MTKFMKKLTGLALGLALITGVGVGVSAMQKDSVEANATITSPYTHNFASGDVTKEAQASKSLSSVSWSIDAATYVGYDATKGIQLGSGSSPQAANWTMSTAISSFGSTASITKISMGLSTASKGGISWNFAAGESSNGGTAGATTTVTEKSVSFSPAVSSGNIVITLNSNGASKAIYIKYITIEFTASSWGTLKSIEVKDSPTKTVFASGETFSSAGLTLTAKDNSDNTKTVSSGFTTNYDDVTFTDSDIGSGKDVTVSYTENSTTKTTTYKIDVIEKAIYSQSMSDWTWPGNKFTIYQNSLVGDATYKWRLSSSEVYTSSSTDVYVLGDYNTSNGAKDTFTSIGYYKSIAAGMSSSADYQYAMYTQNFSVNNPTKIDINWGSTSSIGTTSTAYILASSNGGYSWTSLNTVNNIDTNLSLSWSGSTYTSTNNVLFAFAYVNSKKGGQVRNISISIYGDSLSTTNVWAVQKINITGNSEVEAEQNINLAATVDTTDYETPASSAITWSSSATSIATVNESGQVTGVATGTATITATANDGKGASASKTITVTEKLKRVSTISLDTTSVTKSFVRNSTFNSDGLIVTAHYSNGFADETVTPTSVVAPDMTTSGTGKTVTVTYTINGTSASSTYTIDVTPIVSTYVTIAGEGISYSSTNERYEVTMGPLAEITGITVTGDGDEKTYTAVSDNDNIVLDENGTLTNICDESETASIEVSLNATAKAILFVTVDAEPIVNLSSSSISTYTTKIANISVTSTQNLTAPLSYSWSIIEGSSYISLVDATIANQQVSINCNNAGSATVQVTVTDANSKVGTATATLSITAKTVTSVTWSASAFDIYEGTELTSSIVSSWNVKANYNSSDVQDLSFGDYNLKIGEKTISSLPYAWASEDDGQNLTVSFGGQTSSAVTVRVTEELNSINKPGVGSKTVTITSALGSAIGTVGSTDTGNLSFDSESSNNISWTRTLEYVASKKSDYVAFNKDTGYCQMGSSNALETIEVRTSAISTTISSIVVDCYSKEGGGKASITVGGKSFGSTVNTPSTSNKPITFNGSESGEVVLTLFVESKTAGLAQYLKSITINYEAGSTNIANNTEHKTAQHDAVQFAHFMMDTLDTVCASYPNIDTTAFSTEWEKVKTSYNTLIKGSSDATYANDLLVYADGSIAAESDIVQNAMHRYDMVVKLYSKYAFIDGRTPAGVNQNNRFVVNMTSDTTIAIVAVVSLIGVSAVGGYFFIRKTKHE